MYYKHLLNCMSCKSSLSRVTYDAYYSTMSAKSIIVFVVDCISRDREHTCMGFLPTIQWISQREVQSSSFPDLALLPRKALPRNRFSTCNRWPCFVYSYLGSWKVMAICDRVRPPIQGHFSIYNRTMFQRWKVNVSWLVWYLFMIWGFHDELKDNLISIRGRVDGWRQNK